MTSVMIGSRPVFGSSKSRISGWWAMARAKPTRRRMPPESSDGRFAATSGSWTSSRHSSTRGPDLGRRAAAGAAQRKGDVVEDAHRVEEGALLEGHPELLAHARCARTPSSAQKSWPSTKTCAGVGPEERDQVLEQHALAGARGAHDRRATPPPPPRGSTPSRTTWPPKLFRRFCDPELGGRRRGPVRGRGGQKSSLVRKKSASRIARLADDDGLRRRAAHALRAALRVVAPDAGHDREDQAEDRRLDEADGEVLHVQELEGAVVVRDGVGAEQLHRHEVSAVHADDVAHDHEQRQHQDRGDHAGHDEVLHGLGRERLEGVDLLGDAHAADLGGHRAAHAPGDHQGREHRRQLARQREGHDAADEALRIEPREAGVGLEGQHHPGEERRQEDQRDRVDTDAHHLPDPLRHVVGRPRRPDDDPAEHREEAAELLEEAEDAAPDRLEETDDHPRGPVVAADRCGPGARAGRCRRGSRRESCRRRPRAPRPSRASRAVASRGTPRGRRGGRAHPSCPRE